MLPKLLARRGVLAGLGLALLGVACVGLLQRLQQTAGDGSLPPYETPITHSTLQPQEAKVRNAVGYTVPPSQPRSITLPSIAASGLLQKVAVDQHKAIAVPTNVHVAGWYVLAAKPGDSGVALIDGHVQGRYEPGLFKHLAKLQSGDLFTIEQGNGSHRTFEVVSVASYSVAEVTERMLEPVEGISRQLNLITCGGSYDRTSQQYTRRVLAVSKAID